MKFFLFLSLITLVACVETTSTTTITDPEVPIDPPIKEVIMSDFQVLLDSANVDGSILIFTGDFFFSNDFEWSRKGHLPASTFKIPNSIIALETGVMENDSTISYWDGEPRFFSSWEQDLYFRDAFHYSCVPCYQEIARNIGVGRMKQYTDDFNFGDLVFDSTSIDQFWLEGDSKITQFEQIDFLQRFRNKELPISERTHRIMSRMMIIEQNEEYVLRGKTGWSVQNDIDNCWFVGYVEADEDTYYFATNLQPKNDAEMSDIISTRKNVTRKALGLLGIPMH
ncbi:MAG: penicillin-binding transpeptidase domain-containing protein [Crocinitomicaceae bacterium]